MATTDDYIANAFENYNSTASAMLDAETEGVEYDGEDATEAIYNWALSLDTKIHVEISLTLGGPNVWIDAECTRANWGGLEVDRATFHAAWGSDHSQRALREDDPLWTIAERYVETMGQDA